MCHGERRSLEGIFNRILNENQNSLSLVRASQLHRVTDSSMSSQSLVDRAILSQFLRTCVTATTFTLYRPTGQLGRFFIRLG